MSELESLNEEEQIREKQRQQLLAARRILAIKEARDDFFAFIKLMMPDEEAPDDASKSAYKDTAHGRLLRELVERVEAGTHKRVAVSIPPQHGKTIHLSTYGPAYLLGRNPRTRIIVATYNETRADELGNDFRTVIQSDRYKSVFPNVELKLGSKAASKMATTAGGKIFFVGAGGTVTGRGADYFFIDDPIKDDQEVQSDKFRDDMWKWFFSVAYSRGNKKTAILVIHTRWHSDDLIGRLCDPTHPERKGEFEGIADDWLYLNISAVIDDPELAKALGLELEKPTDPKVIRAFGSKPMCALWADDKDLGHLAQWRIAEPRTFSALAMGKPTVEDGEYFHASYLVEYDARDLPKELRKYGASDHAVSEKQYRDFNVMGVVGIDANDDIWVLPDLVWERMKTDRLVETLLAKFKFHRPQVWWLENELISKSFGPFLQKRMVEEKIYTTMDPITPAKDMPTRARAIPGRMAMQKVRFPRFAPWWQKARSEILQFPYGAHDDFVAFLCLIGLGLMKEVRATPEKRKPSLYVVGSPQWVLEQSRRRALQDKRVKATAGY
jgi:predicted phage terminase large subunit-like protein